MESGMMIEHIKIDMDSIYKEKEKEMNDNGAKKECLFETMESLINQFQNEEEVRIVLGSIILSVSMSAAYTNYKEGNGNDTTIFDSKFVKLASKNINDKLVCCVDQVMFTINNVLAKDINKLAQLKEPIKRGD